MKEKGEEEKDIKPEMKMETMRIRDKCFKD